MSMIPFFPTLTSPIANNLWFDVDVPCDDESEVNAIETEHQAWLNAIQHLGMDLHPLGKLPSEHLDNADSEDEDANDDSDDSESHDDEDEDDMDGIDASRETLDRDVMDTNYSPNETRQDFNAIETE